MNFDYNELEKIEDGLSNKLIYRKTEKENTKIIIDFSKDKQEFKNLLKQKKLIHKTTFIGNIDIDKIPSIATYANSLFLSLKDNEIFSKTVPAKLQTYMSLGKPIIAFLKGEGATIIKDARCGIVEENNNYVELAKNINIFTKKLEIEFFELGKNGKIYYENHFNSELRKQEILKIVYE